MTENFIQFAFSAGVLSESFLGRPDLEKFDLGLREGHNWYVDYRGGASVRRGLEFIDYCPDPDTDAIFIPFKFNEDIANIYTILVTGRRFYFLQSGGFVLQDGEPYSLPHPYQSRDLRDITFSQFRDDIYITHHGYRPRILSRFSQTDWRLGFYQAPGLAKAPTAVTVDARSTEPRGQGFYTMTSIDENGIESPVRDIDYRESLAQFQGPNQVNIIEAPAIPGARGYNFYRSVIYSNNSEIAFGEQLGYIGKSVGPTFSDKNIQPDFTKSPPQAYFPFTPGAIEHINITSAGSGLDINSTGVTIESSTGSGFKGFPIVLPGGTLGGVYIVDPGENYTDATVRFTGDGTGRGASAVVRPRQDIFPNTTCVFQQRRYFFSTNRQPASIFATRPGTQNDFNISDADAADGAFELTVDMERLSRIIAVIEVPSSLFLFTSDAIYNFRAGQGDVVTASNALAEPRSNEGVLPGVKPLNIDDALLYVRTRSSGVRALRPSQQRAYYESVDMSVFSSHYFRSSNPITSWTYAATPDRLLYATRADGTFLIMTYVAEHNVYAWSDCSTAGRVLSVLATREDIYDEVYAIVERNDEKFIERITSPDIINEEDLYAVDSYLKTDLIYPNALLILSDTEARTDDGVFSPDDVGSHIRAAGGRASISRYISPQRVEITWELEALDLEPQTGAYPRLEHRQWSMTPKVEEVRGLRHLEGRTVQVFADGNEQAEKIVRDGRIELDEPASFVVVGLPYEGRLSTLPLAAEGVVIENRQKRVVSVDLRLLKSRGLEVAEYGTGLFYELKERTTEPYGRPTRLQTGIANIVVGSDWNADGSITIRKNKPMLATVLGVINEVEVGDDSR